MFIAVDQWNALQENGKMKRLGEEAPRPVKPDENPIVNRFITFEGLKMVRTQQFA